MRRLYAWVAGAAGGLAAYRALKERRRPHAAPEPAFDSRAAELRARIEEARAAGDDRPAVEGEPPVGEAAGEAVAEPAPLDPQARRRAVHEQGRAALDAMRGEQQP